MSSTAYSRWLASLKGKTPKLVKILAIHGSPMVLTTPKVPDELEKRVKVPYLCGELYKGNKFYGYYAYEY